MKNNGSPFQGMFPLAKPAAVYFAAPFMSYKRTFVICVLIIAMALCASPAAASNEQKAGVHRTVVGGEYDYPPYSHSNAKGEPSGFNAELTRSIAGKMGLNIEIKLGPWAEIRKALEDGKIDAIQGMFYSEERAQTFDFSPPFATINHVVFGRKGSPSVRSTKELRDKELIVMQGDIMHDYVVKNHLSDRLLLAPTPDDVLRLLASGKGDYALVAELPGLYWIKELKLTNLTIVGPAIEPSKYCYAVRKGDAILLSRFTEGLKILQQTGEYRELYEKWLGVLEPSQINKKLIVKYVAVVLVPMAMLLAVSLLWSRMLRKKVNQRTKELQESEEWLRAANEYNRNLIESSLDPLVTIGPDGRITDANASTEAATGYPRNELIGKDFADYFTEPEKARDGYRQVFCEGQVRDYPLELRHRDGHTTSVLYNASVYKDKAGSVIGMFAAAHDITERKRTEAALRESEERFRSVSASAQDAILIIDNKGGLSYWNKAAEKMFQYGHEEIIGKEMHQLLAPRRFHQAYKEGFKRFQTTGQGPAVNRILELEAIKKDGTEFPMELSLSAVKINGEWNAIGLIRDITVRRQAVEALRYSEERFRGLVETTSDLVWEVDENARYTYVSPKINTLLGYEPGEMLGKTPFDFMPTGEAKRVADIFGPIVAVQKPVLNLENTNLHKDGHSVILETSGVPFFDSGGKLRGYRGIDRDITERKKMEKFNKSILESVGEGFVVIDRDYRIASANKTYCEQAGKSLESIRGKHCYEVSHHATQPCQPEHVCGCKRTFETGEPAITVHTHTDEKGKQIQVEIKTYAMKDESGKVQSVIEVINDITEKRALERQLQHAQKMEGIGTLAGGIAHDFNNILSAIIGYGHVTLMKMPQDDPLRMNIEHMLESADRAAALTQSLLTFSRKQIIDRKPVDLNTILIKAEKFLVRVIGEDVEVRMALDASVFTIYADAGQLEQVFMNLATNARDAMPNGGAFTIETAIKELDNGFVMAHGYGKPGRYVMIVATDTGLGMDEKTRKKIFEPFFTTKEVGKGTGLGLAMVYGIIKQHEGFINVYSEPGKGTTFRIYLPLIQAATTEGKAPVVPEYHTGGTETILVAEDDEKLRELTQTVLEEYGYTVITAADGEDAITKFMENKDRVQLLLFDIIMPKKSGREACDEINKIMPAVPVLFASGYSPDMLRRKSLLGDGAALIYKPISPQDLLRKVREVLDLHS